MLSYFLLNTPASKEAGYSVLQLGESRKRSVAEGARGVNQLGELREDEFKTLRASSLVPDHLPAALFSVA